MRVLIILSLLGWTSVAVAQESEDPDRSVSAALKTGVEYDDNVRRETSRSEQGFLTRYFGTLGVATAPFRNAVVSFDLNHGGKFFFRDELADTDTLITQIGTTFQHRFVRDFAYDAHIDMKDRTERAPVRDYNRGGGGGGLSFSIPKLSIRAGGAWRYFAFKPNAGSSSTNVEGSLRGRYTPIEPLRIQVSYTIARRFFETDRTANIDGNISFVEDEPRRDLFHTARASVRYRTGILLTELEYGLALNRSNSFGQDLFRQGGAISGTVVLPLDFFVSARLDLQRTRYDDPVQVDASFFVDEDNRNAVVGSVVKTFGHWELEAKYSLYLQEFGVGSDYRRQTILLAFGYTYD